MMVMMSFILLIRLLWLLLLALILLLLNCNYFELLLQFLSFFHIFGYFFEEVLHFSQIFSVKFKRSRNVFGNIIALSLRSIRIKLDLLGNQRRRIRA